MEKLMILEYLPDQTRKNINIQVIKKNTRVQAHVHQNVLCRTIE